MKTVVVTGAAGGIGSAIVAKLASKGITIVACDRDGTRLNQVLSEIRSKNPGAKLGASTFDINDTRALKAFCDEIASVTGLWGLVNNAGIYLGKDLLEYSSEEMESVLKTNLFSAIMLTQAVGKALVKSSKKGVIVSVSSISAFEGSSDALYGVSKAGLLGLTRSCALTFAPWVRVNAVAPGIVETPLIKSIPEWRLQEFEKGERLGERIQPASVADAVWFLMSDESRHTTGFTFDLNNGGYLR